MNKNMNKARKNKNDEFYTQFFDVEKELKHYKHHLKGKVVYCNTDNYKYSNFVKYFVENFNNIGIKKLISLDLEGNYFEYNGISNQYYKFETGDFRSKCSENILKNADIIVTNPPFSLFREYLTQLIDYKKNFIIVGNLNAVTYKTVFPLLKNNQIWMGFSHPKKFIQPNGELKAFGNICWYTNLKISKRQKKIQLNKIYNPEEYPKYNNYNIINIDRVTNIPIDYYDVMGVPITFIDKYNPDQFEILGIANSVRWIGYECFTIIEDRKVYNRILIRRKLNS